MKIETSEVFSNPVITIAGKLQLRNISRQRETSEDCKEQIPGNLIKKSPEIVYLSFYISQYQRRSFSHDKHESLFYPRASL